MRGIVARLDKTVSEEGYICAISRKRLQVDKNAPDVHFSGSFVISACLWRAHLLPSLSRAHTLAPRPPPPPPPGAWQPCRRAEYVRGSDEGKEAFFLHRDTWQRRLATVIRFQYVKSYFHCTSCFSSKHPIFVSILISAVSKASSHPLSTLFKWLPSIPASFFSTILSFLYLYFPSAKVDPLPLRPPPRWCQTVAHVGHSLIPVEIAVVVPSARCFAGSRGRCQVGGGGGAEVYDRAAGDTILLFERVSRIVVHFRLSKV